MSGGQPSHQASSQGNDYTEEEIELMQKAEEENQERKRRLYQTVQEESRIKAERKLKAQAALAEWKQ